jgi:hypothetical protein
MQPGSALGDADLRRSRADHRRRLGGGLPPMIGISLTSPTPGFSLVSLDGVTFFRLSGFEFAGRLVLSEPPP